MNAASDGNETGDRMTQRVWPLLIVAAGVLIGIVLHNTLGRVGDASHLAISEQVFRWPREPFSSSKWRAAAETERYRFCHDLIERRALVGMTVGDVISLLGPPSTRVPEPEGGWDRLEYLIAAGRHGRHPLSLAAYVDDVTDTIVRVRVKTAHQTAVSPGSKSP